MKRIIVITGIVVSVLLGYIMIPHQDFSMSERRTLAKFPTISYQNIKSGSFQKQFESYTLDNFPLREEILHLNRIYQEYVLQKNDINHLFVENGHIIQQEYPLNDASVDYANKVFSHIKEKYLQDHQVYFSIVPDKNYYANNLKLDYHQLTTAFKKENYIDIFPYLELDDYYTTDPHWRQERTEGVAQLLLDKMNASSYQEYKKVKISDAFQGSYYYKNIHANKEDMYALYSDIINDAKVYDYQNNQDIKIYNKDKLQEKDMYEYYLSGNLSFVEIENTHATTNKELILFKDSFGSAIAPLLLSGYKKITCVDIRFLPSDRLGEYLDFKNQDVLFLYSVSVLNHSSTLK